MESEDKIERRSRSLSAAADDAALAVPVGDLVMQWLSRFRSGQCRGGSARHISRGYASIRRDDSKAVEPRVQEDASTTTPLCTDFGLCRVCAYVVRKDPSIHHSVLAFFRHDRIETLSDARNRREAANVLVSLARYRRTPDVPRRRAGRSAA